MVNQEQLETEVEKCLTDFYNRRLKKIKELELKSFLSKKNPYLYRALGTEKVADLMNYIMVTYIGSSDEGIFGEAFFEPIFKFAAKGQISDATGQDFAIINGDSYMGVSLKSDLIYLMQVKRKNAF